MNKKEYHKILTILHEHKTNVTELNNIQKILETVQDICHEENYIFNEDQVLNYICQPYNDLKFDDNPNTEIIINDLIEDNILKKED